MTATHYFPVLSWESRNSTLFQRLAVKDFVGTDPKFGSLRFYAAANCADRLATFRPHFFANGFDETPESGRVAARRALISGILCCFLTGVTLQVTRHYRAVERIEPMASAAVDFARNNQPRFLSELKDLLRIPSVSTLDEHKPDVQKAAQFVADELRRIGMENVEVIPTKGHPLLYADWLHAPGKPTVLCYAHYDVQPPEPLDEWQTPPFEPTERNNNIYARGAVDDKGQLWMEVKALESLMKSSNGKLPINVKVIFEGEEEVGGESIAEYVKKQKAKLKADFALVCDTELFAPNLPTLCVGLRGLIYTEIEATALWSTSTPGCTAARHQSLFRSHRNHQQIERCKGPRADSWLLQRREGAQQRRTQSLEAPAFQRGALSQD